MFQTFNGARDFLHVVGNQLQNTITQSRPHVLHGNGSNKVFFNRVCDHVMGAKSDVTFDIPSILVVFDESSCVVDLSHESLEMQSLTFLRSSDNFPDHVDVCMRYVNVEENRCGHWNLRKQFMWVLYFL